MGRQHGGRESYRGYIMKTTVRTLLIIDALVNLLLGVLLLLFPWGVAALLGVPAPESNFYPSLLGRFLWGSGSL